MQTIEFIKGKILDAEKSLRARKQAVEVWSGGSNASWMAASNLHPSTAGKTFTKKQRLEIAAREARIAIKCQTEVENFRAVLAELENLHSSVSSVSSCSKSA